MELIIIFVVLPAFVALVVWVAVSSSEKKRKQEELQRIALHERFNATATMTMLGIIGQQQYKQGILEWMQYPDYASALRRIQIMRNSVDIALASSNAETATSRRDLWRDNYAELATCPAGIIDADLLQTITKTLNEAEHRLPVTFASNKIKALAAKAAKLKTAKAREKYLAEARAILEEVRKLPDSAAAVAELENLLAGH